MEGGPSSDSIIAFFVILIIDFVIHGFGMALSHVSKDEIEKKSLENKDRTSGRILKLLENETHHIEAMQMLTIILNMVVGTVCVLQLSSFFAKTFSFTQSAPTCAIVTVLTGILVAVLIMTFGILIPRRLAARSPEKWARSLSSLQVRI